MKIKFKYLKRYIGFFHYWNILFKKNYKYGNLSYHLYWGFRDFYSNWEYWMKDHFKSYKWQGFWNWLYDIMVINFQYITPFLKWSRWTYLQSLHNFSKYIEDRVNYSILKTTSNGIKYYHISTHLGFFKIVEKSYINKNNKEQSLYFLGIKKLLTGESEEIKEVKKTIYKGFIFTKKQALNAINYFKENTALSWESKYCSFNTYFLDECLRNRKYLLQEGNLEYALNEINSILLQVKDITIKNAYNDIKVYFAPQKEKYLRTIRYRLKIIQKKLKEIGYITAYQKKDFYLS